MEFRAHLQLAAQRSQDVQQLTPKLHPQEGVQDGIEAAVDVAERLRHCSCFIQSCITLTGVVLIPVVNCVHEQSDVKWRPADEENRHDGHDDFTSSLLLEILVARAQPVEDAGIAEDQDG